MLADMNGGSNQGDSTEGRQAFLVIDAAKETQIVRFLSLACIIADCDATYILLPEHKSHLSFVNPSSDSVEVCHLWPLSQATLDEGDYLEVADLHQRPGFEGIVSSDGNATRFFVGVVLKAQTAKPLGVLCVLSASSQPLSSRQQKALKEVGHQISEIIVERAGKPLWAYIESAFHLSDQLICIIEPNGFFKNVNPRFIQVLGYDKEFLLSKSLFELVPPEDGAVLRQKLEVVAESADN